MSNKLKTLVHPQVWVGPHPTQPLIEVVVIENFGKGPVVANFFLPKSKPNNIDSVVDDMSRYLNSAKQRLRIGYGIDLGHYSLLCSKTKPEVSDD